MKLKNLLQVLGFRGKPRHYSYVVKDFDLGNHRLVHYAQWLHPGEASKTISAEMVVDYERILNPGDFCIDIGAHSGDSTLPMAIAVGTAGCVLALEPNPFIYHVLEKNARSNRQIANIQTMMAAAASEEGFLEFEYSDSGFCNGGRHEGIPLTRHGHAFRLEVFCVNLEKELFDNYPDYLPQLKYIKVDAEGFDLHVLRSMARIIEEYKPVVKAEVYKNTDAEYRSEMIRFFARLNYSLHRITHEPIGAGEMIDHQNVCKWKHFDILARPNMGTGPP